MQNGCTQVFDELPNTTWPTGRDPRFDPALSGKGESERPCSAGLLSLVEDTRREGRALIRSTNQNGQILPHGGVRNMGGHRTRRYTNAERRRSQKDNEITRRNSWPGVDYWPGLTLQESAMKRSTRMRMLSNISKEESDDK